MTGAGTLRLGFALSAGVATFFAPYAYPLLPGYVAFCLGDAGPSATLGDRFRRAAVVVGLASLGFFAVYAALAGVAAVGTRAPREVAVLELGVGGLLVVLGAGMAAGRVAPSALHVRLPNRERSKTGFLAFGVVDAVAAAGCTAPLFVSIAGVALSSGPAGAPAVFAAYAAGMAALMLLVTGLIAAGYDRLLRRLSGRSALVGRAAGGLLVAAGLAQIGFYLVWTGVVRLPAPLEAVLLE